MKKRREIILWALVLLALAALIALVFPYQSQISYHGTDYAYSLEDASIAVPHEIVIEGTYIHYLLFDDVFQGTFYISGADIVNGGANVRFKFDRQRCPYPSFPSAYGQPLSSDVAYLFAEPNFTQLAVQFYAQTEQDTDYLFLVPGAKSRDEAYETYRALLRASGMTE